MSTLMRVGLIVFCGVATYTTAKRHGVQIGYHIGRADMKAGKEYRTEKELRDLSDNTPLAWQFTDAL